MSENKRVAPEPVDAGSELTHDAGAGGTDDMTTPIGKRSTSPAFQFYPKEFLSSSKVFRMSNTEVGIYIKLLSLSWLDGSLPADLDKLAHMVSVPTKQFTRLWPNVLAECFAEKNGRLTNPRLERVRKEQSEYRAKQAENGKRGGRPPKPKDNPEKAVGCFGLPETEPKKSSASSPASASSSSERTHTPRASAPIHQTHKNHAACGRVCVPATLHQSFVQSLNREDADSVLREWYLEVDHDWSVGAHKDTPTGGNDFAFWRSRFDEKWPAPVATKPDRRLPSWAR